MPNERWTPTDQERANMLVYLECCMSQLLADAAELEALAEGWFAAPENTLPIVFKTLPNGELLPNTFKCALNQVTNQCRVALGMINNAFAMQVAFGEYVRQLGLMKPRNLQ